MLLPPPPLFLYVFIYYYPDFRLSALFQGSQKKSFMATQSVANPYQEPSTPSTSKKKLPPFPSLPPPCKTNQKGPRSLRPKLPVAFPPQKKTYTTQASIKVVSQKKGFAQLQPQSLFQSSIVLTLKNPQAKKKTQEQSLVSWRDKGNESFVPGVPRMDGHISHSDLWPLHSSLGAWGRVASALSEEVPMNYANPLRSLSLCKGKCTHQ